MSKRILILNGHPNNRSFCHALADAYATAAAEHHQIRVLHLADMQFDANLAAAYHSDMPLEEALQVFQESLTWAEHVVCIAPLWWGSIPAKFKGLLDRSLLPGFAFRYQKGKSMPQQLLSGKTAHVVLTMDTPPWYFRWVQGAPGLKQLAITTLAFCGIKPVKQTLLGPVLGSAQEKRGQWLNKMVQAGRKGQ